MARSNSRRPFVGARWLLIGTVGTPAHALAEQDDAEIEAAIAADRAAVEGEEPAPEPSTEQPESFVQSLNPDLTFILDVAAAAFSDGENGQTGGHDPTVSGFNLQQVELAVSAAVDPYFRIDGQIAFSLEGVEVEEFYATTLGLGGGFQVRAGQFLTRFGRINPTHLHTWAFVDQPLAIGRLFGSEGNRGLGAELSWLTPLPWYVELSLSSIMPSEPATARTFVHVEEEDEEEDAHGHEGGGGVRSLKDLEYVAALKQFFPLSDDWSLNWGLSGAFGPSSGGSGKRAEVYGTDLYLKWRPIDRASYAQVALQTEWFYRKRQVPGGSIWDVNGYASLSWRMAKRWSVASRYELGTPARDFSGDVTGDNLDPDWVGRRHRAAASMTFAPSEFSRIRLQGSADIPRWVDEPIYAGFLAVEFAVGAHGAHAF